MDQLLNVSNSWSTAVAPRTLCGTLWRPVAIVLCRIQDFYRAITASRADRGAGARCGMHNARMHSRIAVDLRLAHIYFPCEYEGPTPSIQVARSKKSCSTNSFANSLRTNLVNVTVAYVILVRYV